jgi:UDP:flavonoid glycosyltransferase YjiC (YdhE family)
MASANPHLWVALSGHGFGHLAQTAPVLNALRRRLPALRLTVQCGLAETVLRKRITGSFEHIAEAVDIGLLMANALDVQLPQSLAAYRRFHARWEERLARQEALFERLQPDVLLANIPYLPLAAAARAAVPAVALCSLHWADILPAYCADTPESAAWRNTMLDAYRRAAVFLQPAPSMPMPDLANTRALGPIALRGHDRRAALDRRLGLTGAETLVLVALGGIDNPLPVAGWSAASEVRWLAPGVSPANSGAVLNWAGVAEIPFIDVLESCDVILTKPGYGSFTEAACAGKPVLYVERGDWPEQPWLVHWLAEHGNGLGVDRGALAAGDFAAPLRALLQQERRPPPLPTGIEEAAGCLFAYLSGSATASR